ncbi:acyltransferase family protein [Variovorax sp. LT1P1]
MVAAGGVFIASGKPSLGLMLAAPPLIISLGEATSSLLKNSSRFGDLSYGIYLWAWPVQQSGIYLFGKDRPFFVLLSFSIAATLPLAFVSWHAIEKKALRFKISSATTERTS